jgi:hypothetical protein
LAVTDAQYGFATFGCESCKNSKAGF